eukprot:7594161-Pyramimonas_sp.AAC.1
MALPCRDGPVVRGLIRGTHLGGAGAASACAAAALFTRCQRACEAAAAVRAAARSAEAVRTVEAARDGTAPLPLSGMLARRGT